MGSRARKRAGIAHRTAGDRRYCDLSNHQAEAEANRLVSADARRLYDLGNAPLLRATLVELASDDLVLILNFHHIIADGSSLAIFYRELGLFYDALLVMLKKCHCRRSRFSTRTSQLGSTAGSGRTPSTSKSPIGSVSSPHCRRRSNCQAISTAPRCFPIAAPG